MRILLFERIPPAWGMVFGVVLLILQMVEGTNIFFSAMLFVFIQTWVMAFNLAGGFTRATGAYVFWYGLLTIVFGMTLKAVIGEAADSNCYAPLLCMAIFTASMMLLLMTVLLARRMTRSTLSIAQRLQQGRPFPYREAAIGCTVLGVAIMFSGYVLPGGSGSLANVLMQINIFPHMAVILGTIAAVQESGGKKSTSILNLLPAFVVFFYGFIGFSKQGMFTPMACWGIGIAFTQFRLRWLHGVVISALLAFATMVLFPVAQIGRNIATDPSVTARLQVGLHIIENIGYYRKLGEEATAQSLASGNHYYGKDVGLAERFTTWPGDSALISFTNNGHVLGYDYLGSVFLNWFPHFLLPDKDKYMTAEGGGNFYGREIGAIASNDTSTGVSFSIQAEAFHMGTWMGLFLLLPSCWLLLFLSIEFVCGDLRKAPWGLFYAMFFSHMAPESGVSGLISFVWFVNMGMLICMVFATFVAPLIGRLFLRERVVPLAISATAFPR